LRPSISIPASFRALAMLGFSLALATGNSSAQEPSPKPDGKPASPQAEKSASPSAPELPAQIELLETRVRFEANGDSRKEVHARVRINSELGVRQFARLNFDFNRSFETVEIPLARITHPSGGTADILPGAITDNPNPAVVNAPAYQDVRVKSVRILGLAPGDLLEYRVITTVSHHPLAPDFWFDHSFDRSGVVSQEIFELDLPASRMPESAPQDVLVNPIGLAFHGIEPDSAQLQISPDTPPLSINKEGEGDSIRVIHKWRFSPTSLHLGPDRLGAQPSEPDVVLTTMHSWKRLAATLGNLLTSYAKDGSGTILHKELELGRQGNSTESIYDFVSKKIATVDLPVGATGFRTRVPEEILSSGYATTEDKIALFSAIYRFTYNRFHPVVVCSGSNAKDRLPRPSLLTDVLIEIDQAKSRLYLQPSLEVAPYGVVRADLRGRSALAAYQVFDGSTSDRIEWTRIGRELPFPASQRVNVRAILGADGKLSSKVHYAMRGDNELLLRIAFHQSPKEKWKGLAQLLSISDGFRGQVISVNASDPYATKEPFTVDYEIEQPKLIDWSKKPLRIPALLPQLGLPEAAAKPKPGVGPPPIELGTPLEVETHMTLHLPSGTSVVPPTGTSVQRDYATFSSHYAVQGSTISASRHINFLLEKIPADRAADYNAFLHAVQNDEAQDFSLEHSAAPPAKPSKP